MNFLECIRNSTPYTLYANGKAECPFSNRGSGIADIVMGVVILNFEK